MWGGDSYLHEEGMAEVEWPVKEYVDICISAHHADSPSVSRDARICGRSHYSQASLSAASGSENGQPAREPADKSDQGETSCMSSRKDAKAQRKPLISVAFLCAWWIFVKELTAENPVMELCIGFRSQRSGDGSLYRI